MAPTDPEPAAPAPPVTAAEAAAPKQSKPRRVDEAKAALQQALRASFRASGDAAPVLSDGVAAKAARRVRELVAEGLAADLADGSARLVEAARRSGKAFPWCLLDASLKKPSGPIVARSTRVSQAPGTTADDFADAEDVETQIARWANG